MILVDGLSLAEAARWEATRFALEAMKSGHAHAQANFGDWLGGATGWFSRANTFPDLARRAALLRLCANAGDGIEEIVKAADGLADFVANGVRTHEPEPIFAEEDAA